MKPRIARSLTLGLVASVLGSLHAGGFARLAARRTYDPDALRAYVLPTAEETAWLEIPWLSSFAEGIRAADRQRKPLLLWVMNGHPLGCT